MRRNLRRKLKKLFQKPDTEIAPDEIFLDSSNLPDFDRNQFEGRIEKPIGRRVVLKLGSLFLIIFAVLVAKVWILQVEEGEAYTIQSELNRLRHALIFSERGVILDRNGTELAWNTPSETDPFSRRQYTDRPGFAHLLGYVSYPQKDASGVYYQEKYIGIDGVERRYDSLLSGHNGLKIIEANALGQIESENVIRPPRDGTSISLSIDADLEEAVYNILKEIATNSRFEGGSAVVMDIHSGEILALTSYPEYDPNVLTEGGPSDIIDGYIKDPKKPFLNRAISGLYAPGSIVKPFIALGALDQNVITPEKTILSTGSISIPNPYVEGAVSTFRDWKAHGYVDMRDAIAVSSDVYFYEVGGGFEDQPGLGIENIERYMRMFGIGELSNIDLPSETEGVIPNPAWKEENFPGDEWRVGDTYNTSIGQYGFQVTPIQVVRAVSAIANDGTLLEPHIRMDTDSGPGDPIPISNEDFEVVKEGMQEAVTKGTAVGLQIPGFSLGAKTGTAQVGVHNEYVNSWTVGFFPYEKPRYAFAVVMERAPSGTLIGSVAAARDMLLWINENEPQYLESETPQ